MKASGLALLSLLLFGGGGGGGGMTGENGKRLFLSAFYYLPKQTSPVKQAFIFSFSQFCGQASLAWLDEPAAGFLLLLLS
jgi:hypothetical protein